MRNPHDPQAIQAEAEHVIDMIGPAILAFAWECYCHRGRGAVLVEPERNPVKLSFLSMAYLEGQPPGEPQEQAAFILHPVRAYEPDIEAVIVVEWTDRRGVIRLHTRITPPLAYLREHGTPLRPAG